MIQVVVFWFVTITASTFRLEWRKRGQTVACETVAIEGLTFFCIQKLITPNESENIQVVEDLRNVGPCIQESFYLDLTVYE
jgi:hypothetical protein